MSETSTTIDGRHFAYLAERTRRDDAFLVALKEAARAAGIPPISIAPEQASLMQILLVAAGARTVVEVGTLAGYSAISIARALPADGRVVSIEASPMHARFAREWIGRSDVASRIEVIEGRGADVLAGLPADSADAAFLDADKQSYPIYLDHCLGIVRRGGLVMADNAFAFGQLFDEAPRDREVAAIRAFNDRIAREPALQSVIVPIGDGLWVAVRK